MLGAWALLLCAIAVEVGATASLPRTNEFRDPLWTVAVLGGYAISIWLMTLVIRYIPVSITYAVWSGLGTAGIVAVGALLLGERLDLVKAAALALIVVGVLVLNLHHTH